MLEETKTIHDLYLALGVGGLSFIVILVIMGYMMKYIIPTLQGILQTNEGLKEVLQNNNKAIDEMAKSNHNVATALTLLEKSMNSVDTKVDTVIETQESMEKDILKIKERLPIRRDG